MQHIILNGEELYDLMAAEAYASKDRTALDNVFGGDRLDCDYDYWGISWPEDIPENRRRVNSQALYKYLGDKRDALDWEKLVGPEPPLVVTGHLDQSYLPLSHPDRR